MNAVLMGSAAGTLKYKTHNRVSHYKKTQRTPHFPSSLTDGGFALGPLSGTLLEARGIEIWLWVCLWVLLSELSWWGRREQEVSSSIVRKSKG